MGLVSYWNHWDLFLLYELISQKTPLSIASFSERTGRTTDDIWSILKVSVLLSETQSQRSTLYYLIFLMSNENILTAGIQRVHQA